MQKIFDIKLLENRISVKNLSNKFLKECFVSVKNIYFHEVIFQVCDFLPTEEKTFSFIYNNFFNTWNTEEFYIDIFQNSTCIYKDQINKNKSSTSIVLISNDKFEEITSCLIDGIRKYTNTPIYHYTINYHSKIKSHNLENVYFDNNEKCPDHDTVLLTKPKILLQSLKDGIANGLFMDSDIQVRSNIEKFVNYSPPQENMLILQKSAWDYIIMNGTLYIPGPKVREYLKLGTPENQFMPHGMTNVIHYNITHKDLLEEWHEICTSNEIAKIRLEEYLHDELLLNCLLWKRKTKALFTFASINIHTEKDVKFFYYFNSQKEHLNDLNNFSLGYPSQSYIPRNKDDVFMFHCVKTPPVARKINEIIYNEEILKKKDENVFFKNKLISFYNEITPAKERVFAKKHPPLQIIRHYVDGPYIELKGGDPNQDYRVEFIDQKNNFITYAANLKPSQWTRPFTKYYLDWKIRIITNNQCIFDDKINLTGQRVFIGFDSAALGDNIAWIPYVEEFRKKHNCHVIVSTFHNDLFKERYPDLEFISPGSGINNIFASYSIGCFNTENRSTSPHPWNEMPLQKVASDILGLDYKEIRPLLHIPNVERPIVEKYICIATESTSLCKYWHYPEGWENLALYLNERGYRVVNISKTDRNISNVINANVESVADVQKYLFHCEFFIGLPSGVAWIAWGMNKKVAMISGFSYPWCEFSNKININPPEDICQGCFNWKGQVFDKDWEYCPKYKGTPNIHLCSKSITVEKVIKSIQPLLVNSFII
jgi:autotransporter strand-loop-strand O-heptosyltransferase